MRFKKGEIVPYDIMNRMEEDYYKVTFGVDVEIRDYVIYPMHPMKKDESIFICNGVIGEIRYPVKRSTYNKIMMNKKRKEGFSFSTIRMRMS